MAWYNTGTITATNGSTLLTGSGTLFLENVSIGDGITIAGSTSIHQITNVASETQLSFAPAYTGTTGAGKAYAIVPVQGYVKDLADQVKALILSFNPVAIVDNLNSTDPTRVLSAKQGSVIKGLIDTANTTIAANTSAITASNTAIATNSSAITANGIAIAANSSSITTINTNIAAISNDLPLPSKTGKGNQALVQNATATGLVYVPRPINYAFMVYANPIAYVGPSVSYVPKGGTPALNKGSAYNATTGRFTAPVAGLYRFNFQISRGAGGAGSTPQMGINVSRSGVTTSETAALAYGPDYGNGSCPLLAELQAGDFVEPYVRGVNGVGTEVYSYAFEGHIL